MNTTINDVSLEEFKKISNVELAHTTWNILQIAHEGTKVVKINKLQQLTSRFEISEWQKIRLLMSFTLNSMA